MAPTNDSQEETCLYTLTTNQSSLDDTGVWRCELTNDFGTTTANCSVKVIDSSDMDKEMAPTFVEYVENAVAIEDKPFKFRCVATGNPDPEVKWFRNEIPIEPSGFGSDARFSVKSGPNGENTLEVRRAKMRDGGIYKCKVMNSSGWAACDAKLVVQEDPEEEFIPYNSRAFNYTLADKIKARRASELPNEADLLVSKICDSDAIRKFIMKWSLDEDDTLGFPVHLSSKCAVAGVSVVMGCLMKGKPPLRIRWFKDNKEVYDDGTHFIRKRGGFLSLEIPCVQVEDTGNYTCEVRNDQGKIFTSCYLQVEPVLEITDEVPTKPVFIKPMKRLTVNEGELIRFRVTVKAYPAAGFKWFKDGMEVHDTDRISSEVMPNGVAQLIIENANVRDIGLYACEAHNFAGRTRNMVRISVRDQWEAEAWRSKGTSSRDVSTSRNSVSEDRPSEPVELPTVDYTPSQRGGVFAYAPMFTTKLPPTMPIEDKGHFLLAARSNGNPRPTVTWFKDSKPLAQSPRYKLLSLGEWCGLQVMDANLNDAGIYTVMVENSAGEEMTSCTVEMRHTKDKTGSDVENTGDRLVGMKAVQTTLEAEIFKSEVYGKSKMAQSRNLCNTEAEVSKTADREEDFTTNKESGSEAAETKTVPGFKVKLEDKEIKPGSNLKLEVKTEGFPAPEIKWYKNNQEIKSDEEKYVITSEADGTHTLVINKVHLSDSDCYKCEAINECGAISTCAHVVVQEDSAITTDQGSAPSFSEPLHSVTAIAGKEAVLKCTAKGVPAPKLKWMKDEKTVLLTSDEIKVVTDGLSTSLTILKTTSDDAGVYFCVAENEHGTAKSSSTLKVNALDSTGNGNNQTGSSTSVSGTNDSTSGDQQSSSGIDDSLANEDLENKYKLLPKFVVRPLSHWVLSKEPLEISCQFVKTEGLQVKWYHNDREITPGRFKMEVKPVQS